MIASEYAKYVSMLKRKIGNVPRDSKQWGRLNRCLLHRRAKTPAIPPLRSERRTWVLQPELKANLFAETFQSQATLLAAAMEAVIGEPSTVMGDFVLIRQRWTRRVLANIDEGKATGPDGIPGVIPKRTRRELAAPITRLARRLLTLGAWPDIWRYHWIVPLYKRKSIHNPLHYRGVHLTSVLSKVVEQLLSNVLLPFWEKIDAFGNDQWAFRKKRSYRDLVTLLVASWIMAVHIGNKVGIYLSDIAAFDRVFKQYMLAKCRRAGASDCFPAFLSEFLAPRRAPVIVDGVSSDPFTIEDLLFQGTHTLDHPCGISSSQM